MIRHTPSLLARAGLAVAAALAAPLASAAIVTGNWDPKLPENFGNYGWTARVNVGIDPACAVGEEALTIVNVLGLSFGCNPSVLDPTAAFRILSAEVGIYDWNTKLIVDVLRFNPVSFGAFIIGELQLLPDGAIASLTTPFPSDSQESDLLFADGKRYDFRLALPGGDPRLQYRATNASWWQGFTTATAPVTARQFVVNTTSTEGEVIAATRLAAGQLIFAVPEPGSLALTLLALGVAGGVAARRQRPAAATT